VTLHINKSFADKSRRAAGWGTLSPIYSKKGGKRIDLLDKKILFSRRLKPSPPSGEVGSPRP